MQLKTWLVVPLLAGALLGLLAGCTRIPPSAAPVMADPLAGITLRIACPAPAAPPLGGEPKLSDPAALVREYARSWASHHGATLAVETFDLKTEPPPGADVWVICPAGMPRWGSASQLQPLPAGMTRRDAPFAWTDLLPIYREQLLLWDRVAYAVPLLGEAPLCCYRSDLLADSAARDAFRKQHGRDLAAPATWEQFAQIAEFFTARRGSPSLPPLPQQDAALDRLFYQVAASYAHQAVTVDETQRRSREEEIFSFHYDLQTGRPRIDTPGFVHALQLLQRLQKCRPATADAVPERAFTRGQAVLCVTDACWLATFQHHAALHDKVRMCRLPGGERVFDFSRGVAKRVTEPNRMPYLGGAGWLAVVPQGASHPDAAMDLLADLAGPQTSGQVVLDPLFGAGPVRDTQLRQERWDGYDLDPTATMQLQEDLHETLVHRRIKNPALCLRTPWEASHRAALDARLREVLSGKTDPAAALRAAAQRWAELDRQEGVQKCLADYRISLGLSRQ